MLGGGFRLCCFVRVVTCIPSLDGFGRWPTPAPGQHPHLFCHAVATEEGMLTNYDSGRGGGRAYQQIIGSDSLLAK